MVHLRFTFLGIAMEMEEREEAIFAAMTEVPQMKKNPHKNAADFPEFCVICGKKEKTRAMAVTKARGREAISKFQKEETYGRFLEGAKKLGRDDILATLDGLDFATTPVRYHSSCFRKFRGRIEAQALKESTSAKVPLSTTKMECFSEMMETVINPRIVQLREVWPMTGLKRIFQKVVRDKVGYKISKANYMKDYLQQHYSDIHVQKQTERNKSDFVYIASDCDEPLPMNVINIVLSESDTDSTSDTESDNSDVMEVKCRRQCCSSAYRKARSATRSGDTSDSEEWRPDKENSAQGDSALNRFTLSMIEQAKQLKLPCIFVPTCQGSGLVFPFTNPRWETVVQYCKNWKETEAPEREVVIHPEDKQTKGFHHPCYHRFTSKIRLSQAKVKLAKKEGTFQEKKTEIKILPRLRSQRLPLSKTAEAVRQKRNSPASQSQSCPVPKKPKFNDDDGVLDTESQQEGCLISEKQGDVGSCSENETEEETTVLHSNPSSVNEASEKTVNHKRDGEGRTGGRTVQETGQTVDRDTAAQANDDEAKESDRDYSVVHKSTQTQLPCAFSDYYNCQESSAQVFPFTDIRWRSALCYSAEWRAIGEPEGKIVLLPEDREKKGYHGSCYIYFTKKSHLQKAKYRYSNRKQSLQKKNEVVKKETELETSQSHSSCDPLITTEAVEQGQSGEDSEPLFPRKLKIEKQCTCNCYVKLEKLEFESQWDTLNSKREKE